MKKHNITLSLALAAVFSASTAFAEPEVTGKIVHESGIYSEAGSTIGDRGNATVTGMGASATPMSAYGTATGQYTGVTTATTPAHGKNDAFKSETIAKLYIDGEAEEIAEGATYHIELQGYVNSKATTNYDSNKNYTQRDMLREAYVDMEQGDWSIRAGKQQVVWGTADGMKLLDAINPTDYAEMAQNQMEDSRLPVWMINAETTQEDGSEMQVVISQAKENVFAGLNRNVDTSVRANNAAYLDDTTLNNGTDTGNAFIMKGPDSITGVYNGFLNIVPDLGSVATRFGSAFSPAEGDLAVGKASELIVTDLTTGAYTIGGDVVTMDTDGDALINGFNAAVGAGGRGNLGGAGMEGFVVGKSTDTAGTTFAVMTMTQMDAALNPGNGVPATLINIPPGFRKAILDTWAGLGGTAAKVSAAVGYTVTGIGDLTGATMLDAGFQPLYSANLSSFGDGIQDSAFEYMDTTTFRTFDAFVNAKSQYVYNMPATKDVDVAFRFKDATADGVNYSLNASYNYDKNPIIDLSWRGDAGQKLTVHEVKTGYTGEGARTAVVGSAYTRTTLQLVDVPNATQLSVVAANDVGLYNTTAGGVYSGVKDSAGAATMRFSQEVKRVKQIGGSFDTAIESAELGPVVIRGEVLYTKDTYSPVMNKDKLSYGDLVGSLQMVKGDRLKFVLGADITVLTNMMVSAQFIQDSNLDFVDNGNNYTTDYATMHLSNGFNKGIKDKNFYSLFFSKPFGASGEHRWNNITMLEEGVNGNGKWNRLDAEFSIDDDTQATVEFNKYWGNTNTQFGQLAASSNIQVGVKYSF